MKNFEKHIFSLTLVLIGLIFNAFSFVYAVINPVTANGHSGLLVYLDQNEVLLSFILSSLIMGLGLYLLWVEAYQRDIRKPWLSISTDVNKNKTLGTTHQEL